MFVKALLRRKACLAASALAIGVAALLATPVLAATSPAPSSKASSRPAPQHAVGDSDRKQDVHGRLLRDAVRTTAKDTGLTPAQVRTQLRSGKSLNEIAGSKAAQVEQEAISLLKQRLDKAVSKGKLTQERENALLAKAKTALDKIMAAHHVRKAASGGTGSSA